MLNLARKVIEGGIERGLHVGAQLYVSLGGKPVADLAFGMARDGVPMTPDTIMLWMSAIKPITVVALAQVWERGKIALDDPVAKYIPAFGTKGKDRITIRHVLTHTGGFRPAVGPWTADPWDNIIAQICDAEIEAGWIVGQTSGYHIAPSWYLLAEIVRRISSDGRPYSQYVREEILEPLGMRDTWIGMPAARWREYGDRIAPMHTGSTVKPPGLYPYAPWSNSAEAVAIERPGGNGRGPIHDLGRFYEAMLAGGENVVTPQTIEAISIAPYGRSARQDVRLPARSRSRRRARFEEIWPRIGMVRHAMLATDMGPRRLSVLGWFRRSRKSGGGRRRLQRHDRRRARAA